jgi:hypothetical protein
MMCEIFNVLQEDCSVGFEVLTVVSIKMAVFWVVAPCSLVEVFRCFRGACCIALMMEAPSTSETSVNFTRLHGATTQKTAILKNSQFDQKLLKRHTYTCMCTFSLKLKSVLKHHYIKVKKMCFTHF